MPWCLCALVPLCLHAEAPWAIDDAPYRAIVTLDSAPKYPEAGIAVVLPEFGHTQKDLSDVVLTDAAGQVQPLAAVWRGEGQSAVLLAQSLKEGQEYAVYFGGKKNPRAQTWSPIVSLFMETRRLPPGARLDSWKGMEDLWRRAAEADGAGFVPTIFQGNNPFGESANFATHYTGYLPASTVAKLFLYAQSSDACFVEVNNRLEISWPGIHPGYATAKTVPQKEVVVSGAFARIDYWHAKAGPEPPGMVMGWKRGDQYGPIPESAWVHPGTARLVRMDGAQGRPVPVPSVEALSYLSFNGARFFETRCLVPDPNLNGWSTDWKFEDKSVFTDPNFRRLIIGMAPQTVTVKLRRGDHELGGMRRFYLGETANAATIQKPEDINRYVALFEHEDPNKLSQTELKISLAFLQVYGSEATLGRFAEALLQTTLPDSDPLWIGAQVARLRALSRTDPRNALAELRKLAPSVRQRYGGQLIPLELDLLTFELHDLEALKRIEKAASANPRSDMARLVTIRIGDLERISGKYAEAVQQYQKAQRLLVESSLGRKMPTQDRAYSITITDLLEDGYRAEAERKLIEWECAHPMAKVESDFLLLRARSLMAFGHWKAALAEIDSFAKLQPDSPYPIDIDFYRARVLYETGQKDAARQHWQEIVTKYPRHQLAGPSGEWLKK